MIIKRITTIVLPEFNGACVVIVDHTFLQLNTQRMRLTRLLPHFYVSLVYEILVLTQNDKIYYTLLFA